MSRETHERRVLICTHDLFFRAKLTDVVRQAGYMAVNSGDAPVAVVELRDAEDVQQVERLVAQRARVIAFGSHVALELLRGARNAGAHAVPNSEIVAAVTEVLTP